MNSPQSLLKEYFSYDEFRPGQEDIINSIMSGKDTFAILPTGGGKSICYQIPALLLDGLTIVISPLIALMKDQVDSLKSKGILAEYISSGMGQDEINRVINNAFYKKIKLLYISPERLQSTSFIKQIQELNVSQIAIDEAHCISEWGHDFRPSYREVSNIFNIFPTVKKSAFTATATKEVKSDIIEILSLDKPNVYVKGFKRENLSYISIRVDKEQKEKKLLEILNDLSESAVIYCTSRKQTEKVYEFLKANLNSVSYYHAGLHSAFRQQQQNDFLSGKSNIIVATNAFGMGIDKSDVRFVIHMGLSSTIESYYQEAGRAGRDGKESKCIILYSHGDRDIQEFFININFPNIDQFKAVYNTLFDFNSVPLGLYDEKSVFLSDADISKKSKVPISYVSSVLKHFESNGIISRGVSSSKAKLMIISSRERIREYFENISEDNKYILESLLRSLGGEAFYEAVELDLDKVFIKYGIDIKKFNKAIRSFEFAGIISIDQRNKVPGISLLFPRSELGTLPIDFENFYERKQRSLEKLNEVQRFVISNKCKSNYILNYFGEETKSKCGKCSSCTASASVNVENSKNKYLLSLFLNSVYDIKQKVSKTLISDFLLGKNTDQIKKKNLDLNQNFGAAKNNSKTDIIEVFELAKNKGFLKQSGKLYQYYELNKEGLEYIGLNPDKTEIDLDLINLLNSGSKFENAISKLKLKESDALKLIKSHIDNGGEFDLHSFFSSNEIEKLNSIINDNPIISVREIQLQCGFDVSIGKLRICKKIIGLQK